MFVGHVNSKYQYFTRKMLFFFSRELTIYIFHVENVCILVT